MKNIPSVKAQERITQSRLLYPSAMPPEQTTPLERPKQTAPFERRAPGAERPFFQSKQFLGGFIPTRVKTPSSIHKKRGHFSSKKIIFPNQMKFSGGIFSSSPHPPLLRKGGVLTTKK